MSTDSATIFAGKACENGKINNLVLFVRYYWNPLIFCGSSPVFSPSFFLARFFLHS
jgi:hypothetical protein